MRRSTLLLLASCLFFSCNNKKEEKEADPDRTDKIDSATMFRPEKANNYAPVDISPMDMSYYPVDYPKLKMTKTPTVPPQARVIYSRPHLQGRKLFNDVLKYGESWRLGANEATELDLYTDATIQGKKIKAGRYILYCIPAQETWTIVLNSNIDSWGLHPDPTADIAKFTVPVQQTSNSIEFFTLVFQPRTGGVDLLMAWDNVEARLPFAF
ncbi:MAG TPA: DUF2911 domain-containing protein [Chitinophagaceae bacterium]|jgi:hypothetical protein|nr:DUF2911 domain-containing protein [Chitinophagaceae bacterium]